MPKYTDEDIRNMNKITCKIAADYLGISPMAVSIGMRNDLLPIGFAIHNEERDRTYSESWSYHIIGISKVMQSLKKALTNDYVNERIEKTLLEPGWFILDDRQLGLYKKLYQTICVDNKYWYSTYSGIYSDDLVAFIALLQFMSRFENAEALRNENYDILPEYFNSFVC